jgi:2-amino-4-hydroxy-6-hydroxymethyldihydropteridine diphosphokinase
MGIAYILSGSNQGDRAGYLQSAASYLRREAGKLLECSHIYESASWGFEHPTPFLNQAMKLETTLSPQELLQTLQRIESRLGRTHDGGDDYQARTMDLDILFFDDHVVDTDELVLPHPRMHLRRFALKPLAEIAGGFAHPVFNKTVLSMLEECSDDGVVMKFKECRSCYRKDGGNEV